MAGKFLQGKIFHKETETKDLVNRWRALERRVTDISELASLATEAKTYPFQTLIGLANQLMELQAYALVTGLYYHYLSLNLTPEQKVSYFGYLYPRAFSEMIELRAKKYKY
jgi:hypothetical protein